MTQAAEAGQYVANILQERSREGKAELATWRQWTITRQEYIQTRSVVLLSRADAHARPRSQLSPALPRISPTAFVASR